jgi:hypothetical protein
MDDGTTVWERRELFARYQQQRVLAITLGDAFRGIAQAFVQLDLRNAPRALGLLVRAQSQYLDAGLRRQADTIARYSRFLHRASVATPRYTGRPPTRRMAELALAVKSLTRRNGQPPSTRELAEELGLSHGRVRDLARAARDRGVVTFIDGVPRSIAVPRSGQEGRP